MVEKFEAAISKTVNCKYSVAVNSGTSALHLACMALGLKEGDFLWTSPITFVASANCGLYCGAKIDFVDIDPKTGLICSEKLRKKLESAFISGTLPKIVIPVHLAGTSCDMQKIYELSKQYGFKIIEDASHAIGGSCNNYPVGSCKYSDLTVFSLHPVKIITSAEGGIASTNNEELAEKIRCLRSHGIIKDSRLFRTSNQGQWCYEQQQLGYNYRMSDILAALGLSQLSRLKIFIKKRIEIIAKYKESLSELPLDLLEVPNNIKSSYHLAIIRLHNKNEEFHKYIFDNLRAHNIGVQVHYTPVHLQPYYIDLGFSNGDFPQAEDYSKNAISLPIYPYLSNEDFTKIINKLDNLLS
tara:strand:- start:850 stop:1914 length:1065 start_codon:yes stop_codon:yes gene_type:complete